MRKRMYLGMTKNAEMFAPLLVPLVTRKLAGVCGLVCIERVLSFIMCKCDIIMMS